MAAAPMRVIFKGTDDGSGEPNFGNGAWRAAIEHGPGSPKAKRQMRKAYDQQLDWVFTFWERNDRRVVLHPRGGGGAVPAGD
jgi:hypothetical protein